MKRVYLSLILLSLWITGIAGAQQDTVPEQDSGRDAASPVSREDPQSTQSQPSSRDQQEPWAKQAPSPADRDQEAGESSSRETRIDLSPPKDDAKKHPGSKAAVSDAEEASEGNSDVQEFHPWDPHKALKDIEVGDYYFKRKNYRAALDRYKEALFYKDSDAVATFRLAQCLEKLGQPEEALTNYQGYLRILPHGPLSGEAQRSIDRLKSQSTEATKK
jgi:tetratricopeptide (TPR) repeat protein